LLLLRLVLLLLRLVLRLLRLVLRLVLRLLCSRIPLSSACHKHRAISTMT
jgi:hypothetical protein